jgi:hypothetical protein
VRICGEGVVGSSDRGVEFVAFSVRLVAIVACVVFAIGWVVYWTMALAAGTMGMVPALGIMSAGGAGTGLTITSLLLFKGSRLHLKVSWGVSGAWLLTLGLVMVMLGVSHDAVPQVFMFWFLHTLAAACLPSSKPDPAAMSLVECVHCGYDIRGLEGAKCPECGNEINRPRG